MTIRGVNIPVYPMAPNGQPTILDDFKKAYDEIQQAGGNGVALNPIHYASLRPNTPILAAPPKEYGTPWMIWPDCGQGTHPWPQTISSDLLLVACAEAKSRGLYLMLKPMVDPEPGGWRGNISVKGNWQGQPYDLGDGFLDDYDYRFLARYSQIAADTGVDMLCVGTEMLQITRELGGYWMHILSAADTQHWTYAANWGWADDAEYKRLKAANSWDYTDKIGVDAYFPLLAAPIPIDDKYEQAVYDGWHRRGIEQDWCPRIDDDLTSLTSGDLARLYFTEIGYRADEGAAINPGDDPTTAAYSEAAQVACIRAARRKWDGQVGAMFWWSWELHGSADPRAHNIRGKAEATRVALAETI